MAVVSIVHHRVADFDAWKKVYDGVSQLQKDGGVMAHGVFRTEGDPNSVVVLHTFENTDRAHAFFQGEELQDAMKQAGVDMSSLNLEFLDEVAFGRL